MIFALKASMSSGLRLDTRPWSTTTSSSTHSAPAFRRSVCRLGHEVILRPFTRAPSISVHGPWQVTPTGFARGEEVFDELDRLRVGAQVVRVGDPAGQDEAVEFVGFRVADGSGRLVGR